MSGTPTRYAARSVVARQQAVQAQAAKVDAQAAELRERQQLNRDREVLMCYYTRNDKNMANPSKIMRLLGAKSKKGLADGNVEWRDDMCVAPTRL